MSTTSPKPRVREICPPAHRHEASSTCYITHRCGCIGCLIAHKERTNRRIKLQAYGRFDSGLVDAVPVRYHLHMLRDSGLGYARIAALAGVGQTAVRNLLYGRSASGPRNREWLKRVKRETAERIMAVWPAPELLADARLVPARGTHRRIQALVAHGWSMSKLAEKMGWQVQNVSAMLNRDQVEARTMRTVAALFDELWNTAPPSETRADKGAITRAQGIARARGWAPALAWDDIDTDAEPEGLIDPLSIKDAA